MEHGLWRHLFVFEGNTRVPFLYWTNGAVPELPEPFPAVAIHSLLQASRSHATGRVGSDPEPR